jgi:hypothetical protein
LKRFDKVQVDCSIGRSAFSDERIFRIPLSVGKEHTEHIGAASRQYFFNRKGESIDADQPVHGKMIAGRVAARYIQAEQGGILVSLPDGEVIVVGKDQVKLPREVSPDVSVQP